MLHPSLHKIYISCRAQNYSIIYYSSQFCRSIVEKRKYVINFAFHHTAQQMNIFNSSAYPNKQAYWQALIGLLCLILMSLGYVASRAILSIATVIIFLNAFWSANITVVMQRFKSNKFGWWAMLYFAVCAISYFWSDNKAEWGRETMRQAPFLLLPLGFASVPLERIEFRRILYICVTTISVGTVLVSLYIFASNWQQYVQNYHLSIPMPSTRTGDHIRFSLWLSLLVLLGFQQLYFDKDFKKRKWLKIFVWVSSGIFTVYIHVLSAKTGLLMLYIILLFLGDYFFYKKHKNIWARILPFTLGIVGFIVFYNVSPTFKTKVNYVWLEITDITKGHKLNYNLSDHGRIISIDVGAQELKKIGPLGTGAGDILDVMRSGYETKYPEVPHGLRFMPFNQFLLNLLAYGWVLGLPIFFMSCSPLFDRQPKGQFFVSLTTGIMILTMMFEGTLMLQTGVFVYLFITMWVLSFKWESMPVLKAHVKAQNS